MAIKVAINGYGRIGRNVLRALYESGRTGEIQIVAINDLGDAKTNAHLTRHDTTHGKFPGTVAVEGDYMIVNGDKIRVLANRNPAELPWGELGVDVVMECTGFFTSKEKASAHLKGGAKKVIISAPGGKDVDATIVYGVNHGVLKATDTVISNASCTTNCLAPLVKPLHEKLGLVEGLMNTYELYIEDNSPEMDLLSYILEHHQIVKGKINSLDSYHGKELILKLKEIGIDIEEHIRKEERQLYEDIQKKIPTDELTEIGKILKEKSVLKCSNLL